MYDRQHQELLTYLHYDYFKIMNEIGVESEIVVPHTLYRRLFYKTKNPSYEFNNITDINNFLRRIPELMDFNLDSFTINNAFIESFVVDKDINIIDDVDEIEIIDDLIEEYEENII